MNRVKVAAIQMRCAASVEENLKKAEAMVRKAAAEGANVILLPELFEREYFCQQRRYDFYHYAKPVMENDAVRMGMRLAAELGVVLPISFYERDVNNLYNSIACIDADGSRLDESCEILPEDTAVILFTSGTTQYPKGVIYTHCNVVYGGIIHMQQIGMCPGDITPRPYPPRATCCT